MTSFPQPIGGVALNDEEEDLWKKALFCRRNVSKHLEEARAEKRIGSSLEASVQFEVQDPYVEALNQLKAMESTGKFLEDFYLQ